MDFLKEENGMIENSYEGVSIYSDILEHKYRLVRKAVSLTLCGTIFLNSLLPLFTDRNKLKEKAMPYIEKGCTFIVPYLEYLQQYTNPKPENPCLAKEATVPFRTQEELESIYAKTLEEKELGRLASYDARIEEYCNYFYLDKEKVIRLARTLTDDYTIGIENFLGNLSYQVESEDAAIMMFVYRLYRNKLGINLGDYGFEYEDYVIDKPYRTRVAGTSLVLSSGDSGSEYMGRICDLLGVDKAWALSISMYETGRLNSPLCRVSNNFGGVGGPGGFRKYPTPEAGIIDFCANLKGYESLGLPSLLALSGKYVNGRVSVPSPTWADAVYIFHRQISADMERFFHMPTEDLDSESRAYTMHPIDKK